MTVVSEIPDESTSFLMTLKKAQRKRIYFSYGRWWIGQWKKKEWVFSFQFAVLQGFWSLQHV